MPELPDELRNQEGAEPAPSSLHSELLLLVAEQARRVPLSLLSSAGLMALLVMFYARFYLPATWLAVICALTLVHTRLLVSLPSDRSRSDDRKLSIAAWSFAIHGAALAALLAFFPFVPVSIGAVISIFMVGLCAATLPAVAGFRRIFLPYALVTLGPVALVWALAPGFGATIYERGIFVGLTLAFLVSMLGHAKGTYQAFSESYAIRQQRLELNHQLRDALGKAESANRAKTRFLASASHDLRQPIHALSLFSGSLLLRQLDQRTAGIAAQIDKSVKALASQLDALLDISKLDAGVIEKSIATVDLQMVLSQLFDEFSPEAERRGLVLNVANVNGTMIRTDPILFQRIVRNLISNAIKHTHAGHVDVLTERFADKCRVIVCDTGPGIPQEEHARIFEEFYQLNNPERDRTKGLGLGLAIVRRLTDLLEIDLQLVSAPGQGSQFSIDVPAAPGHEQPQPSMNTLPEPISPNIHVLVVDDEEAIRLGMSTLLEEMGFCVRAAASTEQALQVTAEFKPSIVLADFRLRGHDDGMTAIKALRALWPGLPALLISGDTAPDRLREARQAGIELLHKPVDSADLRESILESIAV